MAISPKLLNEGEHVVVSTRTHAKVLLGALLVLLATAFVTAYLGTLVESNISSDGVRTTLGAIVGAIAVVVVVWFVLRPFVRWVTTTYTFTNRRFMQRSGLIAKEGRTIPLNRISGVDFEIGVVDRLFGCGTLVVSDASEEGRVPLKDIPRVEEVQRIVAEELHKISDRRTSDDGT
ncbi:MAG TPA: PH domain-containing protein [Marmoricola sp.]|nr:PH domain-containing protein [Marmoricola sp.]